LLISVTFSTPTPVIASLVCVSVTPVIYVSARADGTMGNAAGSKLGYDL
jgi:hypothetical protein